MDHRPSKPPICSTQITRFNIPAFFATVRKAADTPVCPLPAGLIASSDPIFDWLHAKLDAPSPNPRVSCACPFIYRMPQLPRFLNAPIAKFLTFLPEVDVPLPDRSFQIFAKYSAISRKVTGLRRRRRCRRSAKGGAMASGPGRGIFGRRAASAGDRGRGAWRRRRKSSRSWSGPRPG